MTNEQRNKIFFILQEIEVLEADFKRQMTEKRNELIQCSLWFDNYLEMYKFIKKFTPDFQSFLKDIQESRELRRQNGR